MDAQNTLHPLVALFMNAIFVYGTLAPGGSRHNLLAGCSGTWQRSVIHAYYDLFGWNCTGGYPAIIPDHRAPALEGWYLCSADLSRCWQTLDDYEGVHYERVEVQVWLDGRAETAWTYRLHRRYSATVQMRIDGCQ